jgi:hypothetical protein
MAILGESWCSTDTFQLSVVLSLKLRANDWPTVTGVANVEFAVGLYETLVNGGKGLA